MTSKSRINKVGAALRRQKSARIIIATQDIDESDIYHAADDVTYTLAELDRLSTEGVQVVKIVYDSNWRSSHEAKVITFNDIFGRTSTDNLMNGDCSG